ncbi:MAG: hypothetical protein HZY75_08800 [Nocardioidaceae bacterium]|nr:MAG: hypothetical protein HZY75_08800 [Nocardioidaceae bacterium]
MSDDDRPMFRVVLRGYEPAQVERRIEELTVALQEAARQRNDLLLRLELTEGELARASQYTPPEPLSAEPAGFDHLGERVAMILSLAEAEAAEIRGRAEEDLAAMRAELAAELELVRSDAERQAAATKAAADTEAARLLTETTRKVDELRGSAEREALTRRHEIQAQLEHEFADVKLNLEQAEAALLSSRTEAEATVATAQREAVTLLENAHHEAATVLGEARAAAAQARADSEREVALAMQRRDSINLQLANVREMLATLSASPASNTDRQAETALTAPAPETTTCR